MYGQKKKRFVYKRFCNNICSTSHTEDAFKQLVNAAKLNDQTEQVVKSVWGKPLPLTKFLTSLIPIK